MSTTAALPVQKDAATTDDHDAALREQLCTLVADTIEDRPDTDIEVVAAGVVDTLVQTLHLHASTVFSDGEVSFRTVTGRIDLEGEDESSETAG